MKDLKPAPKAMPKCLRYYSRKSGASPWTSEHQGKYACRSCTNKGVACLLYDRATKKIILLPLHPEFRTLKDTTIPTDAGYWVRDPSQDARSSPIYGFTRKRKADGEEGEQPGAKRVISS